MMNRSQEIRNNLLKAELKSEFNKETLLYFLSCLILEKNELSDNEPSVMIKNDALYSRMNFLCCKLIKGYKELRLEHGLVDFQRITEYFSKKAFGNLSRMDEFIEKDEDYKSCVRSFFEMSGHISATDTSNRYIEIYFKDNNVAGSYGRLLDRMSISYGISKRRNSFVLYIKKFESISDYLAIIGDMTNAICFQVSKAEIEMQTQIKRTYNLDLASIEKTRMNGAREVQIINEVYKRIGKSGVPSTLIQLCELRINNPESTYMELGELHIPKLSKSSISLKMKKIADLIKS